MREPSAAEALFPNLPSGERPEQAQTGPRLANAMYPRPQQPQLSSNELREAWHEHQWALAGIRRIK
jgi:hypothetical protein